MSAVTEEHTEGSSTELLSETTRVRRRPERAAYDAESVHAILDAALTGHVGLIHAGRPLVIPMLYGRSGDLLYLHGSVASRLQRSLAGGIDACLTVTIVDGLVFARSAFHQSMNYRSAVVVGRATAVEDDEKVHGLRTIAEHLMPGRWAEVRPPSAIELRQTSVLRMRIQEASAKARAIGPVDEPEDLDLPIWGGVLPCTIAWGTPVPDEHVTSAPVSPSITDLRAGR